MTYCFVFRMQKQHKMTQCIQEWAKENLWKTAFKNFEMVYLNRPYHFKLLLRLSSINFTWSILEYYVPNHPPIIQILTKI